ncbi:MAG: aminopeptidase P family protein [Ekhidna sp.]|nr:aminopeptidase P family protein [Ekhidna sp.]
MKYDRINNDLFTRNRKKLVARMKPRSVAIVHSNDIMPTNADGYMGFMQNSNLFYLTGVDQEESIVLIAPDFPDEELREVLFLRETNEEISIWEGHKLTKGEGLETSGISNVKWNTEFEKVFYTILAECDNIYLESNEHIRSASLVETKNTRFIRACQAQYPLYNYERLFPILQDLRCVKSQVEIDLLQQACAITEKGFRRILKFVKPGVMEYEVEAEYLHEFVRNRSKGFAYEPIIGGGGNSCVLHYLNNNEELKDGDILLMDVGAEYANYNADMTRTIPVNGKFSDRQRQVYNAVLRVKNAATDLLNPGNRIPEYHAEIGKIMEKELVDLGLITMDDIKNETPERPAYKKYFMHGTSHHLGIDVHDVASIYKVFEPGMVFTVEPGIYIPEENIGVRIEDDIVITEDGHINLMKNIPIEAEEIEEIMHQ